VQIYIKEEEEWPEIIDFEKKQESQFLPLNHRSPITNDPNYGWGNTGEVEMATFIPSSSRGASSMNKRSFF